MPPMRAPSRQLARPARRRDRQHQGPVRRRGRGDARRLARAGGGGRAGHGRRAGGAAAARGRRRDRRQDQHERVRVLRRRRQSAFRHARQSVRPRARARAARPRAARSRSPTACARSRSAATPAARPAFRRRCAASSAGSRAAQRVPTEGAFPLSFTLDSIGPMARTVAECAAADAVMAGEAPRRSKPRRSPDCGSASCRACRSRASTKPCRRPGRAALARLAKAGVAVQRRDDPAASTRWSQVNAKGGFAPRRGLRDPPRRGSSGAARTSTRTSAPASSAARAMTAAEYVEMARERAALGRAPWTRGLPRLDALVLPTTPIVAPRLAEVATPETFGRKNMMLLRNTAPVNFFDLCAISLPMPRAGGPVDRADAGRAQRPGPPPVRASPRRSRKRSPAERERLHRTRRAPLP